MRVIKVQPVELEAPRARQRAATSSPHSMLFALDGLDCSSARSLPASREVADLKRQLVHLLGSSSSNAVEDALRAAAEMVWEDAGGSLEALAEGLVHLGYDARMVSSAGGTLRQLRHSFLHIPLSGRTLVIDPAFRDQFAVHAPTARFSAVLSAVPSLVVASQHRVSRAALLLAEEVSRAFEAADMPLPPWRQPESLLSKWEAAEELPLSIPASPAPASPAAASPGSSPDSPAWLPATVRGLPSGRVVHKSAGAASARRAQDQARVQEKLARLGLAEYQKSSVLAGDSSPISVLVPTVHRPVAASLRPAVVGFAVAPTSAKPNERVCWGHLNECVCCATLAQLPLRAAGKQHQRRQQLMLPQQQQLKAATIVPAAAAAAA